jgi:hypothetical protein
MKTMLHHIKIIILTIILCWASYDMYAQKETEVFIPLGKSPGVSGKYSVMGRVETVNGSDSTVTIRQEAGMRTVKITASTKIYLDRSKLKLTNTKCSFADCKPGRMVEAKYKDNKPGGLIEWLKVQLE